MIKRNFLFTAFILFFMTACSQNNNVANDADLKPQEFNERMQQKDVVVLDVRSPEEVAEGKLSGSINIDFHSDDFEKKIEGLDKNKNYLVYCRSGNRSGKTLKMMKEKGFEHVSNLDGGIVAWEKEGKEVVR